MTWPKAKLKFVARFGYGDALPTDEVQDGPFQVFGSNGPFASFSRANTGAPAIVVGRKGSYGKVNWTPEPCYASDTTFFVDESTSENHLRWIFWLLQTLRLDEGTDEAAVPGLNRESAYSRHVLVPPVPQQRAIADYLDRETARLDALVAAKERLLGLLAEKRRALITRAVTRGLDPRAPLRDSGIPWLGEIPAPWETERTRWLFKERDQRSATGEEELLTVSHLTGVTPRSEKDVNMFEAETTEGYKICLTGDLVINTLWAWMGAMGVSPVDGIASPAYNVYEPGDRLEPSYLDALVRLPVFAQEVTRYSKGVWSSRLRLYPEGFFEVFLPVPSLSEQRAIVAHIAVETKKIDKLRIATERSTTLLKERRAALIAAVVTGQINVESAA
ncbi:putative restriction endonuclease S subunit [Candidatus Accumulibacter aalborgensis]|uniref:Putative restriction endonuclease S subunit n=1 Tax=Candidatus Accumulibacter aalborgensis TaxID=1860102 RepID=A0A1A8XLA1_9PROT|nr:restriction endonuclease subunit S [Candidatus Accumulibacter aalborgensis]SBT05925.1 putative restriction endonuclease S subunit [Candidatus Accumulibacter aalborgensis]